ncbi:MAG: ankyrin repeat domain-containing protein [Bryobacteraceae bacterium]|nr:ankyrin repeat domain-containing protein [Bryobacteraceae bacterium]
MARSPSTTAAFLSLLTHLAAQSPEPPIIQAVRSGNPALIAKTAADKSELHKLGSKGQTALHEAAARCSLETVLLLVDAGVDRGTVDRHNNTAAMIAADCPQNTGMVRMTRALMTPLPNKGVDEEWRWSLQDAAARGDMAVLNMLLQMGADVNTVGTAGNRAIEIAARKGNAKLVRVLLEKGADVSLKTAAGTAILHEAALGGSAEIVGMLLEKGADPNAQDTESQSTPLHYAASFNRVEAIKALRKGKADPARLDAKNRTPLDVARANNHAEAVAALTAK